MFHQQRSLKFSVLGEELRGGTLIFPSQNHSDWWLNEPSALSYKITTENDNNNKLLSLHSTILGYNF